MFLCFFGCYPIIQPYFHKIQRKWLRVTAKLLYFNIVILAVEGLVMYVLAPESMTAAVMIAFMVMFNFTFICYDFVAPRFELLLNRYVGKLKNK
jgi:hypothetical protein